MSVGAEIAFDEGWRAGIGGDIVRLHAIYYAREWGLGADFEGLVARGLGEFAPRCDQGGSRLFHASRDGELLGALAIDAGEAETPAGACHLRWFILSDAARGFGIGGELMRQAMAHVDAHAFNLCWLTTFAGLDAARSLYERHGFVLTETRPGATWGRPLEEQRFERTGRQRVDSGRALTYFKSISS